MSRRKTVIHIRRCHVCGGVTEQEERIECCSHCGKSIVPFLYYDDEKTNAIDGEQMQPFLRPGVLRPIRGLTAYW